MSDDRNCSRGDIMKAVMIALSFTLLSRPVHAQEVLFQDDFRGKLGEGWSWVREHHEAWRITEHGLEVRIEPGNMWGPQNDAKNLLVRPAPRSEERRVGKECRSRWSPYH